MPKSTWNRTSWVSLVPNGIGRIKPNHYLEMAKVVWKNRDQLPYAWRILTQGVCDGCALGTSGVRDFTMEGIHLCMVRLELMRLNTMPALDVRRLERAEELGAMSSAQLRELGRLPFPMIRRRGESGFRRLSWNDALSIVAERVAAADPRRICFYLTSRGLMNESYYVAQKVARFLGTNNIDNSSRICHSPSTVALKQTLGVAASTCSYKDWIGTDLLVLFGSNTPNNQPVTMKYIYYAKQKGTRVAVVNPYREPGLEHYWIPSVTKSAVFGTRVADSFFQINTGGDRAFICGTLKQIVENGWADRQFIDSYTTGFDELKKCLEKYSWELIEADSGATRDEMLAFARLLAESKTAVFVWSMGITQHTHGVANVRAIVNLALARGFFGHEKCGLMAIRGHSGVQGGAEVGAVPNLFPGGVPINEEGASRFRDLWGFAVPASTGLDALDMIDAAHNREVDLLYQVGGNFLETLPQPDYVREAISRIPLRVHHDIIVNSSMLIEPLDAVVLLPAQTRYEQRGGGTETTTERRILFSPEIAGPRIGECRSEWETLTAIAQAARPESADLIHFDDAQAIREEIVRAVPAYDGLQHLRKRGDQIQWGGERLCEERASTGVIAPRFNTSDGRARFTLIEIETPGVDCKLRLSTRRGKQFNSMVQRNRDPLTGADRDDVLLSRADAEKRGLADGDRVMIKSDTGQMEARCRIAAIKPGNVQVHWPESNLLIAPGARDLECGIPDFNTMVEIVRLD